MSAEVLSLKGFIAYVDVCLELYGVSVNVDLPFGPFNDKEKAGSWLKDVQICWVHREEHEMNCPPLDLDSADPETFVLIRDFPYMSYGRPFLGIGVGSGKVEENTHARNKNARLFRPEDPEIVAPHLAFYAFRVAHEAIGYSLNVLERVKT